MLEAWNAEPQGVIRRRPGLEARSFNAVSRPAGIQGHSATYDLLSAPAHVVPAQAHTRMWMALSPPVGRGESVVWKAIEHQTYVLK
jgi:hypothetical protein